MINPMEDRGWGELGNADPASKNRLRETLAGVLRGEALGVAQELREANFEPDTLVQVDTRRTIPRIVGARALRMIGVAASESRKPVREPFWVVHTRIDAEIDLPRSFSDLVLTGHHTFGIALDPEGELWHFTAEADGSNPRLVHKATVEDLTVKPGYDAYHTGGAALDGTYEIRSGLQALQEAAARSLASVAA